VQYVVTLLFDLIHRVQDVIHHQVTHVTRLSPTARIKGCFIKDNGTGIFIHRHDPAIELPKI
jgi:hypothetical protein